MTATLTLATACVFDFDGTLADVGSLLPLDAAGVPVGHVADEDVRAWDLFHQNTMLAAPVGWVVERARHEAAAGHAIVLVTARRERWRQVTVQWLATHGVPVSTILMRADDDLRPDSVFKAEAFAQVMGRYDVVLAAEDRPSVVRVWRSLGVPTLVVPTWPSHVAD